MKISKYKIILAAADYIVVLGSLVFAAFLTNINKTNIDISLVDFILSYPRTFSLFLIFPLIYIFIQQTNGLYKLNVFLTIAQHVTNIIKSIIYSFAILIIFSFLIKFRFILDSRQFVLYTIINIFFFTIIFRVILLRRVYLLLGKKILKRNLIIIGAGKCGKLVASKFIFEDKVGINVYGFIDDNIERGRNILQNLKVLGSVNELKGIIEKIKVDEVIIAIDNTSYERILEIIDVCNELGLVVRLTSELFNIIPKKIITEAYYGIPIVEATMQLSSSFTFIVKRISDIIFSAFGIFILSPLFFTIGIIIKTSSKGPMFFKQVRIGKDGKQFMFYKFRSMTTRDKEDKYREQQMIDFMKGGNGNNGNGNKVINESRVTKIGKLIRKTSIDELPQLFNVLKGDMSLVGPRPCLPYEYENYDEWQKRRLSVLPGCTGVWQVSGRSEVNFNDSVILDIYYINNMSPWLDLQIIIKTIPVMLLARGGK